MDTYHYVLYIHLLSLFVGIGAAAVLSVCLFQLRGARELMEALPWGRVAGKTGRVFPIAILGLFGSGAYLTSDVWTWSTGWIQVGTAALVVLAIQGPVIAATETPRPLLSRYRRHPMKFSIQHASPSFATR